MVTECNGHMYPTKRFDCEERQIEHALRHLRVHDAGCIDDNNSGVIGWCAFDYNTHKDFGSGDRICYHGVMDMFRIPKLAAYVYKSQISPEVMPVLEPVTFWARGERSIGGIIPITIFTNCDYIEFQYGNLTSKKKIYPNKEQYKGIPHPPVVIDNTIIKPEEAGAWGMKWEDAVFKGYFRDKVVVERKLCCDAIPCRLDISADDAILESSQKDATRVVIKVKDQYNNIIPFIDEIIKIEVRGPGRLQGPNELVVKGGVIAFYVETVNEKGSIIININSNSFNQESVKIDVI
jgi:beta-galactosidase